MGETIKEANMLVLESESGITSKLKLEIPQIQDSMHAEK